MPIEDFVGRWVAGNSRRTNVTIEITIVNDKVVVRAIDNCEGELAEISDVDRDGNELRFAARWSSGKATSYRLRVVNGQLVVDFTVSDTEHFTRDLNPDGTHRRRSGVLHVAPCHSAGYSLRHAIHMSGLTDHVITFRDDLSCGPIDSEDSSVRSNWWVSMFEEHDVDLDDFWRHIASTSDRLVVWFGRHSAREHAFFLALADRLGDRPYDIIDVTGLQMPTTKPGGEPGLSRPMGAVSIMDEEALCSLFGMERAITSQERDAAAQSWHKLKSENAPFRIVTETGLVSAPADVFDDLLLRRATKDWRKVARVIGETMGVTMDPYFQVGDMMLLTRIVALVEQGKLLAHGDPWIMRRCEVRLPD